ncbi:MAG TPA: hypothetical protein PLZ51_00755, partial [Aggregatilineales bacterium]|nr:hypothetical protein [Aggregatilineales bacterium]
VIGVVVALTSGRGSTPPNPNISPTAFPRSTVIEQPAYSISMLDEFIPADTLPFNFVDLSANGQTIHAWYADEFEVFIELTLIDRALETLTVQAQADAHAIANFPDSDAIRFVDEATAEDGTIRKSYRLFVADGEMPITTPNNMYAELPGQLDVFYIPRGSQLAIVKMYTADVTGNRYVTTLQAILDSFRVKESA